MTNGLIRLRDAAELFPKKFGKPVHYNTLRRWARGIKVGGRQVRLRTERLGHFIFTHPTWAEQFARECSGTEPWVRSRAGMSHARRELMERGFYAKKSKVPDLRSIG